MNLREIKVGQMGTFRAKKEMKRGHNYILTSKNLKYNTVTVELIAIHYNPKMLQESKLQENT